MHKKDDLVEDEEQKEDSHEEYDSADDGARMECDRTIIAPDKVCNNNTE